MLEEGDNEWLEKSLELVVNDYLVRPMNKDELIARARTQLRRNMIQDDLGRQYEKSHTAAVRDSLTWLHNPLLLGHQFQEMTNDLVPTSKPISVLIVL